jgi:hypothetical protein
VTDWIAHTPPAVLAKNFGVPADAFKNIPLHNRWIYQSNIPARLEFAVQLSPYVEIHAVDAGHEVGTDGAIGAALYGKELQTTPIYRRYRLMDDPAVVAKQLVELAKKHIEDQHSRIGRQRELIAEYERVDDLARLAEARRVLRNMEHHLARMTVAHQAAEENLAKLTVDGASVEKVVRDTPM